MPALFVLAGLPSSVRDDDEDAKRFDLLILRRQLLASSTVTSSWPSACVRRRSGSRGAAPGRRASPARRRAGRPAGVGRWRRVVDRRHPLHARTRPLPHYGASFGSSRRLHTNPIYTDFEDTIGEGVGGAPRGHSRARTSSASAPRPRRISASTSRKPRPPASSSQQAAHRRPHRVGADAPVAAGGQQVDIAWATEQGGGLGIFVRNLIGLDRSAAIGPSRTTSTAPGSPPTRSDSSTSSSTNSPRTASWSRPASSSRPTPTTPPTGPDYFFPDADVEVIVDTLQHIKQTALPEELA